MSPHMRRIPSLRNNPRIRPHGPIRIQLMPTIRLVIILALATLQTRVRLRSHADSLARLDERDFGPDAESRADDFC